MELPPALQLSGARLCTLAGNRQARRNGCTIGSVVINCREPATRSFYAGLLGLAVNPGDAAAITAGTLGEDESVLLGSETACMWLTPIPDPQPVPGRVPLDVRSRCEDLGQLIAWRDLAVGRSARTLDGIRRPGGQPFLRHPPGSVNAASREAMGLPPATC